MRKIEASEAVRASREPVAAPRPLRRTMLGPKAVGSFVPRLTQPAFEKYGFSAATLITDWAGIVGSDLAKYTSPERLKWPKLVPARGKVDEIDQGRPGATLVLRVDQGRALDIQYKAAQIIERINAYFGYGAVADLRIVQGVIARTAGRKDEIPGSRVPSAPPPAEVLAVKDDGLRSALERMAAGLHARAAASNRRNR